MQGKHFTHEWERSIKAKLDKLHLDKVTIIGASLGGMLAPRAAAFDNRIKCVVAWSIFTNFFDVLIGTRPPKVQNILRFHMKYNMKALTNMTIKYIIKHGDEMVRWDFFTECMLMKQIRHLNI